MIRLHINPPDKALLEQHDLASYEKIMASNAGELIDEDARRDVRRLQLGDERYFLKRTRVEKKTSALESYFSGKMAHSKPYKEMLQIRYLTQRGFHVAQVVTAGEELRFGVPVAGFILTREAPGVELSKRYQQADTSERLVILAQLGTLVGKLHRQGFFLSVRLKDVFFQTTESAEPQLTLIDREARNPAAKGFSPRRAKESLFTSWRRQVRAGDAIEPLELRAFVRTYLAQLDGVWSIKPAPLLAELRKMAKK